ncbi:hypothetical protein BT96DRAFT_214883 [Gymnopus androsaceus JB14]|uniref:Uncharacterized protein n=1 Tax=Gymnopus androsaceus JB14 TaxID=1447944 RepID=A0A6A4H915_9AGAR|nr:hypothetical protein BT96DRAFT_214883 [Gymnopus androsaceus JB14]
MKGWSVEFTYSNILPWEHIQRNRHTVTIGSPMITEQLREEYESLHPDDHISWTNRKRAEHRARADHGALCQRWHSVRIKGIQLTKEGSDPCSTRRDWVARGGGENYLA